MSHGWEYKSGDLIKECNSCHLLLSLDKYSPNKGGKYNVRAVCNTCLIEKRKFWKKPTKEKQKQYTKAYIEKFPERYKEAIKKWRKNNLAYDAFRSKTYRERKRKAVPIWANLDKIKEIYLNCPKGFHVDHVIPLRGKLVSGLHIETNLQYLSIKENLSKRNSFNVT